MRNEKSRQSWADRPWLQNLVGALLLMAISGHISIQRGQDANWDLKNYHWYNAYAFWEGRLGFDIAPAQLQSFHNPLLDLPYFWLATTFPMFPQYAAFLQGTYFGLVIFFLIKISLLILPQDNGQQRTRLRLRSGSYALTILACFPERPILFICAVIVGATGVATVSQLGSTMNEMQLAALILAGLYCLLIGIEKAVPTVWLAVAGTLIGSATGLKLTATTFLVGAAVAVAGIGYLRKRLIHHLLIFTTFATLGFALFQGYWFVRLTEVYENPLFPYFNQLFMSEWWEPKPISYSRFFPETLFEWIFYPFYWITENHYLVMDATFRDPRLAIVYIFVAVFLFQLKRNSNLLRPDDQKLLLLVIFTVVAYATWLIKFSIYRYLIPLEVLSGIFLVELVRRLPLGTHMILVTLICSVAVVTWSKDTDWGHVAYTTGVVTSDKPPEVPPGSLILLLGSKPLAYVTTLFPKEVRFIGVDNNLIHPGMKNRLQTEADNIIEMHDKPIFIVESLHGNLSLDNSYLSGYGLTKHNCSPFPTNLDPSGLQFCQAHKAGFQ